MRPLTLFSPLVQTAHLQTPLTNYQLVRRAAIRFDFTRNLHQRYLQARTSYTELRSGSSDIAWDRGCVRALWTKDGRSAVRTSPNASCFLTTSRPPAYSLHTFVPQRARDEDRP